MKKISQFDWPTGDTSFHGKQISVHTRELVPETDSCNRFAHGACSLISNQFDMREQNSGAKVLLRNICFARNRWCRRGSVSPGACCRGMLQEQAPSCLPAFRLLDLNCVDFVGRSIPYRNGIVTHNALQNVSDNNGCCICCI